MANVIGGEKLEAFLKKIRSLNGDVKVGFFEQDMYSGERTFKVKNGKKTKNIEYSGKPVPVAYIAKLMEYGCTQNITEKQRKFLHVIGFHLRADTKSLHIPARPFVMKTFNDNHRQYKDLFASCLANTNYDIDKALNQVGMKISGDIKKAISEITTPANHGFTIQQKGFDKPLKGKGASILQKSVKHEVYHK